MFQSPGCRRNLLSGLWVLCVEWRFTGQLREDGPLVGADDVRFAAALAEIVVGNAHIRALPAGRLIQCVERDGRVVLGQRLGRDVRPIGTLADAHVEAVPGRGTGVGAQTE